MIAKSFLALAVGTLVAACSARGDSVSDRDVASVAQAVTASSIYTLVAQQHYTLPEVPADLVTVADFANPSQTRSLLSGVVIGAWTTAPTAGGEPAALVYHCQAGAGGTSTWAVLPDAGLTPMGLTPAQIAAALPFTAAHTQVVPPSFEGYLDTPSGPSWSVDGQLDATSQPSFFATPVWTTAAETAAHTEIIGTVEAQADSPNKDSVPLYRYGKSAGITSSYIGEPTVDRADYVLRLNTKGGIGPGDEGATCDAGAADVRSSFSADFYFITLPPAAP